MAGRASAAVVLVGSPDNYQHLEKEESEDTSLHLEWKGQSVTIIMDESFLEWMKSYFIRGA